MVLGNGFAQLTKALSDDVVNGNIDFFGNACCSAATLSKSRCSTRPSSSALLHDLKFSARWICLRHYGQPRTSVRALDFQIHFIQQHMRANASSTCFRLTNIILPKLKKRQYTDFGSCCVLGYQEIFSAKACALAWRKVQNARPFTGLS